jgi:1-acyl-sn-glycerol-3-phosphate acyltransferase
LSAAPAESFRWRAEDNATVLRLAPVILWAALFIVVFGPLRRFATARGWRFAERAPVRLQRILCAGLGARVRQHGEFSPAGRQLIVANHVSWLDIPILGSLRPMSFLAKKEIGNHWVGRELVALQGVVYVDRQRRRGIPEVNARMAAAMSAGAPVVLFAEATTGDGNRLLRFRSSHFEAIRLAAGGGGETVVQPVYLAYSRMSGLPIARAERPIVAWYGDMRFLGHLLRYARTAGVNCDVYCGTPIAITPDMNRKAIARLTEAAVRALARQARERA